MVDNTPVAMHRFRGVVKPVRRGPPRKPKPAPVPAVTSPTCRALLIGQNYPGTVNELGGCIRDIENITGYLRVAVPGIEIDTMVDRTAPVTRRMLFDALDRAATLSATTSFYWIHYSGHGTYVRDTSRDEKDGRDEAIYMADGVVSDDAFARALEKFASTCTVFIVFDSCYSGTMGDLKYAWPTLNATKATMDQPLSKIKARVMCVSGCQDSQTSAEIAGAGAMTTALLQALGTPTANCLKTANLFTVVTQTQANLRAGRLSQVPLLTTSFNLAKIPLIQP